MLVVALILLARYVLAYHILARIFPGKPLDISRGSILLSVLTSLPPSPHHLGPHSNAACFASGISGDRTTAVEHELSMTIIHAMQSSLTSRQHRVDQTDKRCVIPHDTDNHLAGGALGINAWTNTCMHRFASVSRLSRTRETVA